MPIMESRPCVQRGISDYPDWRSIGNLLNSLACVKKAAAIANRDAGRLESRIADAHHLGL